MTKIIKHIISDSNQGCLNFDLRDLLVLIPNLKDYTWTLYDMNFNYLRPKGRKNPSEEEYKFIESINDSKDPLPISVEDLIKISELNIQTIDGEITGKQKRQEIKLIAFDSSYWIVLTTDFNISEKLKIRFKDIRIDET